jgi:hypothetical protein
MEIIKKSGGKNNYFADTRPELPTYDLDKLVEKGNALRRVPNIKAVWEFEGVTFDNYEDYKVAYIDKFAKDFPPFFTREGYPQSATVVESTEEDVKMQWNKEWLLENYQTDVWLYFIRTMERNIVHWYTNGTMEGDFITNLDEALEVLRKNYGN